MLALALILLLVPSYVTAGSSDEDRSDDRSTLVKPGRIGVAHGVMRIEGALTITYNRGPEWCTYRKDNGRFLYRNPSQQPWQRQCFTKCRFIALAWLFSGEEA